MMSIRYKKHQQGGFILALALIMMLFVGIVVITSSERTGQETRTAQSQAPTATLQAAAEAGLLTLRQRIDHVTTQSGEACEGKDIETTCECLENLNLSELMVDDSGYEGNEFLFSSKEGLPDTYWWFESGASFLVCYKGTVNQACKDKDLIPKDSEGEEIEGVCRIAANVFVGDPAAEPGHFMAGTIDIKVKPNNVEELFNNKKLEELGVDDIENIFYEKDEDDNWVLKDSSEIEGFDSSVFSMTSVSSGGTLNPAGLSDDKINLIILEGKANIELSSEFDGKQIIIVSRYDEDIGFSGKTGKDGAKGSGAGGVQGWIAAPDSTMQMGSGIPDIDVNVKVDSCKSINSGNTIDCFGSQGGSGFKGDFGSDDFDDPDSTGNVKVDSSDEMEINFDY